MPRKADTRLEGRILDAAYRIWSERGEDALTMRAVARAARTTTPTLYERFSQKSDLLALLRRRARRNLFSAIRSSRSPAEACRRALDFLTAHPHDYRLVAEDWAVALARKEPLPSFEFLEQRLVAQLGGAPHRHMRLALALIALVNGTATLLHSSNAQTKIHREFRRACISACAALIHCASQDRSRPKRSFPPLRTGRLNR
jgi:AcrR family transcriptional regulator